MKKICAMACLMFLWGGQAHAGNYKVVFESGGSTVGSVAITDTRSGRCHSGTKKRLRLCNRNFYICSGSIAKFNRLARRSNASYIRNMDRSGYPRVC